MKFEFDGCGSRLKVELFDVAYASELIQKSQDIVSRFETKYSRFIPDNYLSRLNSEKQAPHTQELVSLLKLAKKVSHISQGYYDITVLPFLENRGYGIHNSKLLESYGSEYIEIGEQAIILHNDVSIDLGSLGKGYLVDMLYKLYEKYSKNFIIDFGGDIRVRGKHIIQLEDPRKIGNILGEIELVDMAIAASSPIKRQFGEYNHLVQLEVNTQDIFPYGVFVLHEKALFADIFSTALMVSPRHIGETILRQTKGLMGIIYSENGKTIQSKNFTPKWYT